MSKQKKAPNTALMALTTAALTLPGISTTSKAATAPTENLLSYRFSKYQEEDAPAGRVISGSNQRYDIDVHQLRVVAPVDNVFSLDASIQHEVLSGASPWSTEDPDADGNIDLVMSGASIRDERTDITVGVNYYYDEGKLGVSLANSSEDDYKSHSIGFDWERDFNNKHSTFNVGLSISDDKIDPQDNINNENSIDPVIGAEDKDSLSLYAGIGQIIDKNNVIQSGIGYTKLKGYLTDPYKLIDRRPDTREQLTWNVRYRHNMSNLDAALHLDYRFYHDTWDVDSHTIKLSWYQNLDEQWQVVPFLRYYSQTEAEFYVPIDDAGSSAAYFSSDARLSQFGAVSGGLRVVKDLGQWSLIASGEYYVSSASYALSESGNPEHQGLIKYTRFTIGVDYKFN